jgi:hypothetical protein
MPSSPARPSYTWAILLGLTGVCWLLAAVFAIVGSRLAARGDAAQSWPTIEGTMLRSAVSEQQYGDPKDGYTKSRLHRSFTRPDGISVGNRE